jgi:hypothetical protein
MLIGNAYSQVSDMSKKREVAGSCGSIKFFFEKWERHTQVDTDYLSM